MVKRKMLFGNYDTAANGWTLAPEWYLSAPEQKTNYVDKPGGNGTWDLSTALTDGEPVYNDRVLEARFECSEGDRLSREDKIRQMVNQLDGRRMDIELPDDIYYHLNGRLHVAKEYNDPAHAAVIVTADCEPWKYKNSDTVVTLTAASSEKTARLVNNGRRAAVPSLKVTGSSVTLKYKDSTITFSAGTYKWPELLLTSGNHELIYSGSGTLTITYKEAVLE